MPGEWDGKDMLVTYNDAGLILYALLLCQFEGSWARYSVLAGQGSMLHQCVECPFSKFITHQSFMPSPAQQARNAFRVSMYTVIHTYIIQYGVSTDLDVLLPALHITRDHQRRRGSAHPPQNCVAQLIGSAGMVHLHHPEHVQCLQVVGKASVWRG
jgi:hypothetical protein